MNWRLLISPYTILPAFAVGIALLTISANGRLWVYAFGVLLLSVMFVFDREREYPALIWAVGINWASAAAAIFGADLVGVPLADEAMGEFGVESVKFNLLAVIVYAAGLAWSTRARGGMARLAQRRDDAPAITLQGAVIAYFSSLVVTELASYVAITITALQQPLVAFFLLKYVCIFLVAYTVFINSRGYSWLCIILSVEVVTGMTGFFGTFKEGFFIVLIAFLAAGRRPSLRTWMFGAAAAALVLVLSVVWTSVKPEYRRWVSGFTSEQIIVRSFDERVAWMADRLLDSNFDYWKSFQNMVDRIDSTGVFAQYLVRRDMGDQIDLPSRYIGGFQHVLMPRFLFPDKASLDDSSVTTAMTGRKIDANTSISIGYLAEAHYDFGPWWMYLPVLLIGVGVGGVARYFMTRDAPRLVRQAFTTTILFSFFQFGTNFDKALGTFIVGSVVLGLVLRFGYPRIAGWLSGRHQSHVAPAE